MIFSNSVFMDFGNTRLKVMIGDSLFYFDYKQYSELDVKTKLQTVNNDRIIYYSTVTPHTSNSILSLFTDYTLIGIDSYIFNLKHISMNDVVGMGTDRILGLLGAVREFPSPLITVDCGTMITLNIMSKNNNILGGMIMPGLTTMAKASNNYTAALPMIETWEKYPTYGKNTADALQSGILSACIGGIDNALQRVYMSGVIPHESPIIFTGGDGLFLSQHISTYQSGNMHYRQHLIINGMKFCVESGAPHVH